MGWPLQRRFRLIVEGTRGANGNFQAMHKRNRSPELTVAYFKELASPTGMQFVRDLFIHFGKPTTLRRLGLAVTGDDVPLDCSKAVAKQRIDEEAECLLLSFDFQIALCSNYVRRMFWHQEGISGAKRISDL